MAKNKQSAAEARGGSSAQDEGEEESESASASESECEEKEVENEEQEQDVDQDEGEEGSASESESESEEKEDENTIPAPLPKKPSSASAAQHPQSSSSSSSSGESDSSPVDHCGVDPNMKMMQSNAAASASAKNKKPISKKPICNPTPKRPVVDSESENRKWKRAKAVNVNADVVEDRLNKTSASKVFFQRLWSPEDEILILEGIIHHTADTGLDPSANINDFYLSIKNSIHVHVTKTQLSDKVRKLKKKYMTNANKAQLPSKPHDQQVYKLSQKIWGFNKDGKQTLKEDASNKMAEIARELKKVQICQLELLRKTELLCQQTKRVLESLQ
ncbi:STOREKEEPER protein-like isoform X1 [Camellia sinensis]|uniref:STOREKEEPER protein-like isoform X1 n=1 Tax=Camellia sinensis TaxID=4442 RepID=UPI001036F07B|nr:STOREKEEPER protein-like isoform X1 [Camellia sinensis]